MIQPDTMEAMRNEYRRLAGVIGGITLDCALDKPAYFTVKAILASLERAGRGTSQYTAKRVLATAKACHITRNDVLQSRLFPDR